MAPVDQLVNLLEGAVVRALRRQNSLAIATSGGLDSSILAALVAEHADIPIQLVTAGAPGSADPRRARQLASHLDLPLAEIALTPRLVERTLARLAPLLEPEPVEPALAQEWGLPPDARRVNPVRAAVGLVLFAVAEEAARHAKRLLVGQGADEWFAGYARYEALASPELEAALARDRAELEERELPFEARIANAAGVEFQYPYLNDRVKAFAGKIPAAQLIAEGERKLPLRAVAESLRLPVEISRGSKLAAQYGSGAADLLRRLAEDSGLPQNEYLTRLATQRTMGEPHSFRT